MSRRSIDRTGSATDALSEALRAARVRSVTVLNDTYEEPWGVAVPGGSALAPLVGAGPDDLVAAFHVVEHGTARVDHGDRSWPLGRGDVFISFLAVDHVLRGGQPNRSATPMLHLLQADPPRLDRVAVAKKVDARVLCGVFLLERIAATDLERWLPPVLHLSVNNDERSLPLSPLSLACRIRLEAVNRQPGAQHCISRLLELLLGDALRCHAGTAPGGDIMLDATRDGVVWQALCLIREDPGRSWTVDDLASACAVSRSTLTERFQDAVGRSPIRYLTDWRLHLAAERLEHSTASVERIGHSVGYSNQPAFSRAFKRAFATTPSAWRETRRLQIDGR